MEPEFLGGVAFEDDASSALVAYIQALIDADVSNGNGDKIAQVQVNPTNAVTLALLSYITPNHLRGAKEHDDCIDIPQVSICNRCLTVRVTEGIDYAATADEDGNIIP